MTTLDLLAARHGAPHFVKIDVEGYELDVLRGMSTLPPFLSFEIITPEWLAQALACIDYIDGLGPARFTYSLGDTMELQLPDWTTGAELKDILRGLTELTAGDVIVDGRAAQSYAGPAPVLTTP